MVNRDVTKLCKSVSAEVPVVNLVGIRRFPMGSVSAEVSPGNTILGLLGRRVLGTWRAGIQLGVAGYNKDTSYRLVNEKCISWVKVGSPFYSCKFDWSYRIFADTLDGDLLG